MDNVTIRPLEASSEDLRSALLFATTNGWRPPEPSHMSDEERSRPTIPAPALKSVVAIARAACNGRLDAESRRVAVQTWGATQDGKTTWREVARSRKARGLAYVDRRGLLWQRRQAGRPQRPNQRSYREGVHGSYRLAVLVAFGAQ